MNATGSDRWAWLRSGRWEPYAWLIYSIPFLAYPLYSPIPWWQAALVAAAYPAFLALYLGGQHVSGRRAIWHIVGLDLLALGFGGINPASGCFHIYGSSLAGRVGPARRALTVLAMQAAIGVSAALVLRSHAGYWLMLTLLSMIIGAVTIQATVNAERDASLRLAQDEVRRLAQVAERERIARDLHDVLGHTLSVIVLKSELARKLVARDPSAAVQEIAEVERVARAGLAEVRETIVGYRAAGLSEEVVQQRQLLVDAGIAATVDAVPVVLDPARDTALALALREAATNVIRHAGASSCRIGVSLEAGVVRLVVADDGRGLTTPFGNGLTGMRERIEALGGRLTRETGRGTRLTIELPAPVVRPAQPVVASS